MASPKTLELKKRDEELMKLSGVHIVKYGNPVSKCAKCPKCGELVLIRYCGKKSWPIFECKCGNRWQTKVKHKSNKSKRGFSVKGAFGRNG